MSHCPSKDWDRYIAEQDSAAEAEAFFFRNHRDEILQVACALIAGGYDIYTQQSTRVVEGRVIKDAAEVVRLLNESGELP